MALNKNIFYATNPARISDALMNVMEQSGVDYSDMLIFLPSRRAVRTVEKMLVQRAGRAVLLPTLIPLGEGGAEDADIESEQISQPDVISDLQRVVVLSSLLSADSSIGNISTALSVAQDLVRMMNYLENEGVDTAQIDWHGLIDEKYAAHFQHKAELLNILTRVLPTYANGKITETARRNMDIRAWINVLDKYKLVIVCCSTASVPATADLMRAVARSTHGRIILSGAISGAHDDLVLDTNPYNSEYKFLQSLGLTPDDVQPIDVGPSAISFFNHAFGNNPAVAENPDLVRHCHLVVCNREAEEAAAAAEIAARSAAQNKTVLIITPDAAGNQRLKTEIAKRGIVADFSGGISGAMTGAGRAILNQFNDWIDAGDASTFDKLYLSQNFDLFRTIVHMVDSGACDFAPAFDYADAASMQVWDAIKKLSDCLNNAGVRLTLNDAYAFLSNVISAVSVRDTMNENAQVIVLGTIESRMQTADVVILTGLNDGMFPSRGYENAWLPQSLANEIGLPSPDRKVSLMSLDFMNLSCGADVYWLRSRASGGVQTAESRFLSRVIVRGGQFDTRGADDILSVVRGRDNVPRVPLDYSYANVSADWSDVYVTELELLIHNPYAYYARHILRLYPADDYWMQPDARQFGTLVHAAIENMRQLNVDLLVSDMDARAREILGAHNILLHFWHKRFVEIAPVIVDALAQIDGAVHERGGRVKIAGRNVCARADLIWDGGVMDFKTGAAPNKKQLSAGNMPQLPLEAYILQSGGFALHTTARSKTPVMTFLQLQNNKARAITYDTETTANMINAAVLKTTELFNMYSAGNAPYEYRETNEDKYKAYDELARRDD